jgi:hypothetical protein
MLLSLFLPVYLEHSPHDVAALGESWAEPTCWPAENKLKSLLGEAVKSREVMRDNHEL